MRFFILALFLALTGYVCHRLWRIAPASVLVAFLYLLIVFVLAYLLDYGWPYSKSPGAGGRKKT